MKDKSKKHDHKGTKILKLSIFASVMLAPLFAIGFKCAYATFNKNANLSYSQRVEQSIVNINTNTTLEEGRIYTITYVSGLQEGTVYHIKDNVTNIKQTFFNDQTFTTITRFSMLTSGGRTRLQVFDENDNNYSVFNWEQTSNNFYFMSNGTNGTLNVTPYYRISTLEYTSGSLDNALYYAVNQMKDNDLFAWTKNTALYTPINAMTSGLGITTDAIAVLLAYWLYITLIYVVFDIVIELFTYLSHLIMGNPIG